MSARHACLRTEVLNKYQLRENCRQPLSAAPLPQGGTASFRNICKARKDLLYLLSTGQPENNNAGLISVWCIPWTSVSSLQRSCRQQRMAVYYLRNGLSHFKGTSGWGKGVHAFVCVLAQYLHWFYCKRLQILDEFHTKQKRHRNENLHEEQWEKKKNQTKQQQQTSDWFYVKKVTVIVFLHAAADLRSVQRISWSLLCWQRCRCIALLFIYTHLLALVTNADLLVQPFAQRAAKPTLGDVSTTGTSEQQSRMAPCLHPVLLRHKLNFKNSSNLWDTN